MSRAPHRFRASEADPLRGRCETCGASSRDVAATAECPEGRELVHQHFGTSPARMVSFEQDEQGGLCITTHSRIGGCTSVDWEVTLLRLHATEVVALWSFLNGSTDRCGALPPRR